MICQSRILGENGSSARPRLGEFNVGRPWLVLAGDVKPYIILLRIIILDIGQPRGVAEGENDE